MWFPQCASHRVVDPHAFKKPHVGFHNSGWATADPQEVLQKIPKDLVEAFKNVGTASCDVLAKKSGEFVVHSSSPPCIFSS